MQTGGQTTASKVTVLIVNIHYKKDKHSSELHQFVAKTMRYNNKTDCATF